MVKVTAQSLSVKEIGSWWIFYFLFCEKDHWWVIINWRVTIDDWDRHFSSTRWWKKIKNNVFLKLGAVNEIFKRWFKKHPKLNRAIRWENSFALKNKKLVFLKQRPFEIIRPCSPAWDRRQGRCSRPSSWSRRRCRRCGGARWPFRWRSCTPAAWPTRARRCPALWYLPPER